MEKIYALYNGVVIASGSKQDIDKKIKGYGRLDKSKIILTKKEPSTV